MDLQPSPVKAASHALGIPVLQPRTLRNEEVQKDLAAQGADVFVVVAYGLILPPEVLDTPPLGCVNVHFSLLPLLRGAAPVQWALLEGHAKTGVSIMQMDPGLDTGPVLEMVEEPIRPDDDSGTLAQRLSAVGASVLADVIGRLEDIEPVPQPETGSTYAAKLSSEDARLDWALPARVIWNRVRAFAPKPGAWTTWNGKRLKILKARHMDEAAGEPGVVELADRNRTLRVGTGEGVLELVEVQPEGRSRMSAEEFVRGYRVRSGDRFG